MGSRQRKQMQRHGVSLVSSVPGVESARSVALRQKATYEFPTMLKTLDSNV